MEREALICANLEEELADATLELVIPTNGQKAVAELESDGASFRAFVTGIRLGRGCDGWVVARCARKARPDMPSVCVSVDSAQDWEI